MSEVQQTGFDYLWTYSGILKIIETILNSTLVGFIALAGYEAKSYFLNGVAIYALICTVILLLLHVKGLIWKSKWPWYWIECVNCLLLVILFTLASSILISALTKGFIITGVVGYIVTLAYFLDTVDKYHLAVTPRARYVWTTPNMPE